MSQQATKVPEKRLNIGLPADLYKRVSSLADKTHRTLVGVIAYMTEQMEREEGVQPATASDDANEQPEPSVAR